MLPDRATFEKKEQDKAAAGGPLGSPGNPIQVNPQMQQMMNAHAGPPH